MPESRRPERESRRSYRSARRREQETASVSQGEARKQRSPRPQGADASSEKMGFYAAGEHVLRPRSTSTIQRVKTKKKKRWVRPLLISLTPVVVIVVGLVAAHFVLLGNAPVINTALAEEEVYERNNFPLYYRDLIEQNADHYNLPASLIAAMVLAESSFEAGVENRINARGLMQLMPNTAQWVGEKLDEEANYSFDMMLNAKDNLRYGCWYLQYLVNRFDGNMVNAVCGYHAGQGNVDSWLANGEYSRDGKTLDKIPTSDTGAYARRVLNAQQIYQRRYFLAREGTPTGVTVPQTP